MKRLLLTLTILAGANSLHGMESQKQLSPITLPQAYHRLLQYLLPEITQHIFSLQLKASGIDPIEIPQAIEQSCKDPDSLVETIETLVNSCGYELASELCKQCFPQKRSICNIKDRWTNSPLHVAVIKKSSEIIKILIKIAGNNNNVWKLLTTKRDTAFHWAAEDGNIEIMKLLLDAAGNNAWTLLTMKDYRGRTALHWAANKGHIEAVKFLLDAAGDKAQDLMDIQADNRTAFTVATSEAKKVMQKYQKTTNVEKTTNADCVIS